jgi:hypothetical protein
MPVGRPTAHSPELAETIAIRIASGESLRAICQDPELPDRSTVLRWALRDEGGFRDQYESSLRMRAEGWADEIVDLADQALEAGDSTRVHATRLSLDARKWVASRLLPKKYGDRAAVDVGASANVTFRWESSGKQTAPPKRSGGGEPGAG